MYLPEKRSHRIVYITLLTIAGTLVIILIIGTIFAFSCKAGPVLQFNDSVQERTLEQSSDIRVFSGLGRMRIPLVNSSVMILSISFPFPADDIAFSEELAVRINDFKHMATDYFSTLPEDALVQINEETAKQEILRRYNNSLRLGRIETLYFNELRIIDSGF